MIRALAVISLAVAGLGLAAPLQSARLSTDKVVALAAAYVTGYQRELAFLLADETTTQRVVARAAGSRIDETQTRVTRGELFITYLEARKQWTAVRDVAEVDGAPVAEREDLPRLLANTEVDVVARRLFALNARYNLGSVVRNFNDPMLALLPLNDAHRGRFSFSLGNIDRSQPGVILVPLRFRERERPTLIRTTGGGPTYSRGEILVDAATGVVRRTQISVSYDRIDAELTTDFRHEDRLGLWVPSLFRERYLSDRDGRRETATVESSYSNYRRFEVRTGVIVPVL